MSGRAHVWTGRGSVCRRSPCCENCVHGTIRVFARLSSTSGRAMPVPHTDLSVLTYREDARNPEEATSRCFGALAHPGRLDPVDTTESPDNRDATPWNADCEMHRRPP